MIRPASTLCLLRAGPGGMEVAMVRRAGSAAFVGGAYVFPGGAVEEIDRSDLARRAVSGVPDPEMFPWVAAALREAAEEAGVLITTQPVAGLEGLHGPDLYQALAERSAAFDGARLAYLSNWVTPEGPPRRFDTRFFVAVVDPGTQLRADGDEVTRAVWVAPQLALERADSGEWLMIPPTLETLRVLGRFGDPAEAVAFAAAQDSVPRFEPQLVTRPDGSVAVLMPGGDEAALP